MKKFKKYIAVLCGSLTLGLGGCNDFLDIYDPAVVTPEYYNTKEGQEKLIVNLYARYRSVFTTYVLQYLATDMYMSCDESPKAAQFNGYNADLKWEETTTWNAGIDMAFLNNRVTTSIDFYKRNTEDLLNWVTVDAGSNLTNAMNANIGSLENIGVEFAITARPIVKKNFTWTTSYNEAWN